MSRYWSGETVLLVWMFVAYGCLRTWQEFVGLGIVLVSISRRILNMSMACHPDKKTCVLMTHRDKPPWAVSGSHAPLPSRRRAAESLRSEYITVANALTRY